MTVRINEWMIYKQNRKKTFYESVKINSSEKLINWKDNHDEDIIDPLVDYGLYYTPTKNNLNRVLCYFCNKTETVKKNSNISLFPKNHFKKNKGCFISLVISSVFEKNKNDTTDKTRNFWEFHQMRILRCPLEPASIEFRHIFFDKRYPHDKNENYLPRSQKLAEAGFIYSPIEPNDDRVICFYCECTLDHWEFDDNPIKEHKKNSERYCFFLDKFLNQKKEEDTLNQKNEILVEPVDTILETDKTKIINKHNKVSEPKDDQFDTTNNLSTDEYWNKVPDKTFYDQLLTSIKKPLLTSYPEPSTKLIKPETNKNNDTNAIEVIVQNSGNKKKKTNNLEKDIDLNIQINLKNITKKQVKNSNKTQINEIKSQKRKLNKIQKNKNLESKHLKKFKIRKSSSFLVESSIGSLNLDLDTLSNENLEKNLLIDLNSPHKPEIKKKNSNDIKNLNEIDKIQMLKKMNSLNFPTSVNKKNKGCSNKLTSMNIFDMSFENSLNSENELNGNELVKKKQGYTNTNNFHDMIISETNSNDDNVSIYEKKKNSNEIINSKNINSITNDISIDCQSNETKVNTNELKISSTNMNSSVNDVFVSSNSINPFVTNTEVSSIGEKTESKNMYINNTLNQDLDNDTTKNGISFSDISINFIDQNKDQSIKSIINANDDNHIFKNEINKKIETEESCLFDKITCNQEEKKTFLNSNLDKDEIDKFKISLTNICSKENDKHTEHSLSDVDKNPVIQKCSNKEMIVNDSSLPLSFQNVIYNKKTIDLQEKKIDEFNKIENVNDNTQIQLKESLDKKKNLIINSAIESEVFNSIVSNIEDFKIKSELEKNKKINELNKDLINTKQCDKIKNTVVITNNNNDQEKVELNNQNNETVDFLKKSNKDENLFFHNSSKSLSFSHENLSNKDAVFEKNVFKKKNKHCQFEKSESKTIDLNHVFIDSSTPYKNQKENNNFFLNKKKKKFQTKSTLLNSFEKTLKNIKKTTIYLKKIRNSKNNLNDDFESDLTNFISSMPENEENMTIKEWISYTASKSKLFIKNSFNEINDFYYNVYKKNLEILESIPTND